MGKTKFTFVGLLRPALLLLTFGLLGSQAVLAQCNEPVVTIGTVTATSIEVNWVTGSANNDQDHTFRVTLFADQDGLPNTNDFVFYADLNATGDGTTTFGVDVGDPLPCNTRFRVRVREFCDDMDGASGWAPNPGAEWNNPDFFAPAIGWEVTTFSEDFVVTTAQTANQFPTCPGALDGCFDVIVDATAMCCVNPTFTVTITGPGGPFAPQVGPAGTFTFCGVGGGPYQVDVQENSGGACFLPNNGLVTLPAVALNPGVDIVAPDVLLQDPFGIIYAASPALANGLLVDGFQGLDWDFGTITLPEGECGRQDFFYVFAEDNCAQPGPNFQGPLAPINGLVATDVVTAPGSVLPGTQAFVTYLDPNNSFFARVDVHWSAGASTVTITVSDNGADGMGNNPNTTDITLSANVIAAETDLAVNITGIAQGVIPACATSHTFQIAVSVTGGCDLAVTPFDPFDPANPNQGGAILDAWFDLGNGGGPFFPPTSFFPGTETNEFFAVVTLPAGTYQYQFGYQSPLGNIAFAAFNFEVIQATQDAPPQIDADSESFTIPSCDDQAQVFYSFQVSDDCAPINVAGITFNDGGAGLTADFAGAQNCGGNCLTVEVSGPANPGNYTMSISYGGVTVTPTIDVDIADNQAPAIAMPGNTTVNVPICSDVVETNWAINISDDCDDSIDMDELDIYIEFADGTQLPIVGDLTGPGTVEFGAQLNGGFNGATLNVEYADSEGAPAEASVTLVVNVDLDGFAPVVVYPSNDLTRTLDPCGPDVTEICFYVTAADNCGIDALDVDVTNDDNGAAVAIDQDGNQYCVTVGRGEYTVDIAASDVNGNDTDESFAIIVNQGPRPATNLICNDQLNATLNANCQLLITADMVLDGGFGCLTEADFIINIADGVNNGNIVDGCGTFNYTISLRPGITGVDGFPCGGTIVARDNYAPTLACPDDVNSRSLGLSLVTGFAGTIDANDPVMHRSSGTFTCTGPVDHHYDAYPFTVTEAGLYIFDVDSEDGNDPYAFVMATGWNPADPCPSVLAFDDDDFDDPVNTFNPLLSFQAVLPIGQYEFVLTTFSGGDFVLPNYTVTVSTPDDGGVIGEGIAEFICDDLDPLFLTTGRSYVVDADGDIVSIAADLEDILDITGYPDVADNCGDVRVFIQDEFVSGGDCGDDRIERTFYAQDKVNSTCTGNPNTSVICTQIISSRKATFDDIVTPLSLVELDCNATFATLANGNPAPSVTGYPVVRTALDAGDQDNDGNLYEAALVPLADSYCNLGASFVDLPRITVCAGTYKFIRDWTILDWCAPDGENVIEFRQVIKVGDADGPSITLPDLNWDGEADTEFDFSTSPYDCNSYFTVPMVTTTETCSGVAGVTVTLRPFSPTAPVIWNGVPGQAINVPAPVGTHYLTYTATDGCGNTTSVVVPVNITDEIAPTASCDDDLNISLGGQGFARIFAADIDEGSNDNCSDVTLEVRRNYRTNANACSNSATAFSAWGNFVDFECCDLGKTITIELRVTDAAGNSNICWLEVEVEDKLTPYCYAPHDVTIDCTDLPYYFPNEFGDVLSNTPVGAPTADFADMLNQLFGAASGTDNCGPVSILDISVNVANLSDCGYGTIVRRFQAWQDVNGNGVVDRGAGHYEVSSNNCQQTITINEVHDYVFWFPADDDADCAEPDELVYTKLENGCDILAVNVSDPVRYDADGDECYKEARTISVINWCVWNGEDAATVIPRRVGTNNTHVDECERVRLNGNGTVANIIYGTTLTGVTTCINPSFDLLNQNDGGHWSYVHFTKVYDSSLPEITVAPYGGPTDVCPDLGPAQFGSIDNSQDWVEGPNQFDGCDANVSIDFCVTDPCGITGLSIIDIYLDAFVLDANADGVIKESEFTEDFNLLGAGAAPFGATLTNNGGGCYTIAGEFPIIDPSLANVWHAFRVRVEDGCGNESSVFIPFDVVDCKAPTPVCINGLALTLMPQPEGGCAMSTWAEDFIASPIYDCTGQGPATHPISDLPEVTKYSIYRMDEVEAELAADPSWEPSVGVTGVTFTDQDLITYGDPAYVMVYIYAFDEAGNYGYCETYVQVNAHNTCATGGGGSIAGLIATEEDETVQNVEVNLSGNMAQSMTTAADGQYTFGGLEVGPNADYTVTPYLDVIATNAVSTFDLVLMSKHILGVQLLNSPYKMIAADVNRTQTITTLDLIQLRKVILNIDTEFANNTGWRFIRADYNFPVPTNPWFEDFSQYEVYSVNDLGGVIADADFVAIATGDVNGSASANAFSSDDRNVNGEFNFNVAEVEMNAGEVYTVEFTGADMARINGYQLTLALEGAELVDIVYGVATEENFGMRFVDEGMITMSWNGEATAEDVLFTLVLRAEANAQLSEVLGVSSRYTAAEAYDLTGNTMNVGIKYSTGTVTTAGFEVYQNTPNPFKGETLIGFNLPVDAKAQITISDVTGRVVTVMQQDGFAGYNQVTVTRTMLNGATGVMTYTVTAGDYTATKTMVVVD